MIQAADLLKGTSRIWVNCLWDTLCGGHEDDQALLDPEAHYGYLINTLGASIIQTDRPEFLISYLKAHNLH
jgi:glycerophosphoryl diester phosphodiesterase